MTELSGFGKDDREVAQDVAGSDYEGMDDESAEDAHGVSPEGHLLALKRIDHLLSEVGGLRVEIDRREEHAIKLRNSRSNLRKLQAIVDETKEAAKAAKLAFEDARDAHFVLEENLDREALGGQATLPFGEPEDVSEPEPKPQPKRRRKPRIANGAGDDDATPTSASKFEGLEIVKFGKDREQTQKWGPRVARPDDDEPAADPEGEPVGEVEDILPW